MSLNQWTQHRLSCAALGSLLSFGATSVLDLAASVGVEQAWAQLRAGRADELSPAGPQPPSEAVAKRAATIIPEQVAERTESAGLRFITAQDEQWPSALNDLANCSVGQMGGLPVGLWLSGPGNLADWAGRAVAMVGSRAATRYGETVALRLASELADGAPRWTIVSGGAFGVDAASHRGALAASGRTIGVFANGLDVPYPPGNTNLVRSIETDGLAISELPPGSHPTRPGFLARNRLIAALSSGTVIVEAALRSGARNTVSWAGALGRVVMAVPGPVTSAMSVTPHRLIRDGEATLVATSDDIRALLQPVGESPELPFTGAARWGDDLDDDARSVREALPTRGGLSVGEAALTSGLPVQRCAAALQRLYDGNFVIHDSSGLWRARPNRLDI